LARANDRSDTAEPEDGDPREFGTTSSEPDPAAAFVAGESSIGHSAAGAYLGFSVQISRTVAHLLKAHPGQAVCMEHLDDVATVGEGTRVVEQDKSGLAHNPVADRSSDLWKTLHVWIEALRTGAAGPSTRFVLYVAQPHSGKVIRQIDEVHTQADGENLARRLRGEYMPSREGELTNHQENMAAVLSASDELLGRLFVSVSFEVGSGLVNDDLLPAVGEKAVSEGARENVLRYLLGWAKTEIDRKISLGQVPVLTVDDFNEQLLRAAKKFDRSGTVLFETQIQIDQRQVQEELSERTYVRQLKAIDCIDPDLEAAVVDYLRSAADRVRWAETGDVLEDSFGEFQRELERAWTNHRLAVEIEAKLSSEVDRGQLLRSRCMLTKVPLQGMQVPSHFVPGSLHRLADSVRIGWHPRWDQIFGMASGGQTEADQ
jgi:hypothetical protein